MGWDYQRAKLNGCAVVQLTCTGKPQQFSQQGDALTSNQQTRFTAYSTEWVRSFCFYPFSEHKSTEKLPPFPFYYSDSVNSLWVTSVVNVFARAVTLHMLTQSVNQLPVCSAFGYLLDSWFTRVLCGYQVSTRIEGHSTGRYVRYHQWSPVSVSVFLLIFGVCFWKANERRFITKHSTFLTSRIEQTHKHHTKLACYIVLKYPLYKYYEVLKNNNTYKTMVHTSSLCPSYISHVEVSF